MWRMHGSKNQFSQTSLWQRHTIQHVRLVIEFPDFRCRTTKPEIVLLFLLFVRCIPRRVVHWPEGAAASSAKQCLKDLSVVAGADSVKRNLVKLNGHKA